MSRSLAPRTRQQTREVTGLPEGSRPAHFYLATEDAKRLSSLCLPLLPGLRFHVRPAYLPGAFCCKGRGTCLGIQVHPSVQGSGSWVQLRPGSPCPGWGGLNQNNGPEESEIHCHLCKCSPAPEESEPIYSGSISHPHCRMELPGPVVFPLNHTERAGFPPRAGADKCPTCDSETDAWPGLLASRTWFGFPQHLADHKLPRQSWPPSQGQYKAAWT